MEPLPEPTPKQYDLDLRKIEDEPLAVMAQEADYQEAARELIVRHHELAESVAAAEARKAHLIAADVEDVRQYSFFALHKVVTAGYHTSEMVRAGGCHLKSHLFEAVTCRAKNKVRSVRRNRQHYDRSVDVERAVDPLTNAEGDPAQAAVFHELWTRIEQFELQLDRRFRVVWDEWRAGKTAAEVARLLGRSPRTVERIKEELRSRLVTWLREWSE